MDTFVSDSIPVSSMLKLPLFGFGHTLKSSRYSTISLPPDESTADFNSPVPLDKRSTQALYPPKITERTRSPLYGTPEL